MLITLPFIAGNRKCDRKKENSGRFQFINIVT